MLLQRKSSSHWISIMMPNTPHAAYTLKPAICHGGHFISTGNMEGTLFGMVHSFMGSQLLTNTEHYPSRQLLRRIVHFYHGALVDDVDDEKRLQEDGTFSTQRP
jgi:hypothetical protein